MKRLILCIGLFVAAMPMHLAHGRQAAATFEVASIKPTTSTSGVTGGCRGIDSKFAPTDPRNSVPVGRCVITAARLSHLMSMAFAVPLRRISGFPEWDGPSRFDIQAKAEDPATTSEQQLISMLQAFMTQQFKLSLRRETRDAPIFGLVVSKNGVKNLRASEQSGESMLPTGASLVFKGYSMERLAEFLSGMPAVDRPVRNMTEIPGRFDFTLNVLETKPENIGEVKMAMARWETIFSDVQEQLGLRLESTKGPVENLIIEHAEKPVMQNGR